MALGEADTWAQQQRVARFFGWPEIENESESETPPLSA